MKTKSLALALAACLALLLAACGPGAAPDTQSEPDTAESVPASDNSITLEPPADETGVYRGRIDEVMEDGAILVTQLAGFDYGQAEVLFLIDDDTQIIQEQADAPLAVGSFVEVVHDAAMTFSIPPQATANSVTVLAATSDDIVVNGEVVSIDKEADVYHIMVHRMDALGIVDMIEVVLLVPPEAFERITPEEIQAGTKVSAVTKGIETLSEPPQMPVHVLLPYTEPPEDDSAPAE